MNGSFTIQGTLFLRAGIALLFIWLGLDHLIFTEVWVASLPNYVGTITSISPTTVIHFNGALELVFGSSLLLGLFTRASSFLLLLNATFLLLFLGFNRTMFGNSALLIALFSLFIYGADSNSIDNYYLLESNDAPMTSLQASQFVHKSSISKILFGVIGVLLISIVAVGTTVVRSYVKVQFPQQVMTDTGTAQQVLPAVVATSSSASTANKSNTTTKAATVVPTKTTTTPKPAANTFTMAQVAQHNTVTNCYTVVRGLVYNLTAWIKLHPGGEAAIVGLCGVDGTDGFVGQHGGARNPEAELAHYKIGTLAQ